MQVQHCPDCGGEYVAQAKTCAECGGALKAGPPPARGARRGEEVDDEHEQSEEAELEIRLDTVLATLPGQQAHVVAACLAGAGIFTAQRCKGEELFCGPGLPDRGALARSMIVQIYVAHADLETAQEMLAELQSDGEIKDPTEGAIDEDELEREAMAAAEPLDVPVQHTDEPHAVRPAEHDTEAPFIDNAADPASSSSSSMTLLIVALVGAVVILGLLLGR